MVRRPINCFFADLRSMRDSCLLRFLFCNFFFVVQNPSRSQTAFFFNFSWHVYHSSETKRSMFDEKLPHFGIIKRNPNCCFFISSNFGFATVDITSLKLLEHKEIYLRHFSCSLPRSIFMSHYHKYHKTYS